MQQTSLMAFHSLLDKGTIGRRQQEIIDYLTREGPATDGEMASALGYAERNSIAPRRNELVRCGLVTEMDRRKDNRTGRIAIVWGVTYVEKNKLQSYEIEEQSEQVWEDRWKPRNC